MKASDPWVSLSAMGMPYEMNSATTLVALIAYSVCCNITVRGSHENESCVIGERKLASVRPC